MIDLKENNSTISIDYNLTCFNVFIIVSGLENRLEKLFNEII